MGDLEVVSVLFGKAQDAFITKQWQEPLFFTGKEGREAMGECHCLCSKHLAV